MRGEEADTRHVVREAEALELPLLVEVVDGFEGDLERRSAVGGMEIPHINAARVTLGLRVDNGIM